MTDTEIKKALECCCGGLTSDWCDKCPMNVTKECDKDLLALEKLALDLINRLQAENERLNFVRTRDAQRYEEKISNQAHTNCVLIDLHSATIKEVKELEDKIKTAKSEAYKEFAERLEPIKKFRSCIATSEYEFSVTMREIDNLLKELVGDK